MKLKLLMIFLTAIIFLSGCNVNDIPSGLMIEFIREPEHVVVHDLKPEFSWIVPDRAVNQTASQILVASSESKIRNNEGDIWDSGRMNGSGSTEIEYGGNELKQGSHYYWKVRIWDEKNEPTGYSGFQSFKTGNEHAYATTGNRFRSELIKPVKMTKVEDDHFFIDFGKDAFGKLLLNFSPTVKDTLIVHLGEKLDRTNHIDRKPSGSIRYYKVVIPVVPGVENYTVETPPDKMNTGPAAVHLPDSFGVVSPFRYCEIENTGTDLTRENVKQKVYWYNFDDDMSSFTSSDTLLNRIWDLCKYSMKATSFTGKYIDGDRERIPYEGDAYINQLGHYCTDREYAMARITNEHFMSKPTWPTEWILQTVLMFYNDYMYTGNIESVRIYYEALKHKTLLSLAREDGLISSKNVTDQIMTDIGFVNPKIRIRDIVDWPPAQKDTKWILATPEGERDGYEMVEINTVVNAFHYRNLVLMAELASRIGKSSDSGFFINRAEKVKNSFNTKLLDSTRGIYTDGEYSNHSSLHANMMALAFGLVPIEFKQQVTGFIKSRGMACSVYGSQFLLEGLYYAGEEDYALSLMTATHDRSWWNMIKTGSTITLEAWDMKYKPNSDWNHAWGAAPANIIPRNLWGIVPGEPGFSMAIIKPQMASLTSSRIEVPTIRGSIKAEYKVSMGSKEYSVTLPANMKGEFVITGDQKTVTLNGKVIAAETGRISLKPGRNKIKIEVIGAK